MIRADGVSANSTTSALTTIAIPGQHLIIAKHGILFVNGADDISARFGTNPVDLE